MCGPLRPYSQVCSAGRADRPLPQQVTGKQVAESRRPKGPVAGQDFKMRLTLTNGKSAVTVERVQVLAKSFVELCELSGS
jgi:hypothetical protein